MSIFPVPVDRRCSINIDWWIIWTLFIVNWKVRGWVADFRKLTAWTHSPFLASCITLLKWRFFYNSEKSAFPPFLSHILTVIEQWVLLPTIQLLLNNEIHMDSAQEQEDSELSLHFFLYLLRRHRSKLLIIMQLCPSFEMPAIIFYSTFWNVTVSLI